MRIKIVTNFSKARMESFYRFHFLKKSTYRVIEFIAVIISMILSLLGLVLNNTYLFAIFLVMCLVIILTRKYRINRIAKNIIKKNPPLGIQFLYKMKLYHILKMILTNNIISIKQLVYVK